MENEGKGKGVRRKKKEEKKGNTPKSLRRK